MSGSIEMENVFVPENEVGVWQWLFGKTVSSIVFHNNGQGDGFVGIAAPSLARILPVCDPSHVKFQEFIWLLLHRCWSQSSYVTYCVYHYLCHLFFFFLTDWFGNIWWRDFVPGIADSFIVWLIVFCQFLLVSQFAVNNFGLFMLSSVTMNL